MATATWVKMKGEKMTPLIQTWCNYIYMYIYT
jgi:hypothetical protein